MPDVGTGLVAVAAAQLLAPPIAEFFKRITGKMGDDVGGWMAELTTYRCRNTAELLRLAHEKSVHRGGSVDAVPPRLLGPLLVAASLEDDAYLLDHWASLLATAALERSSIPPYYVNALAQLAPADARMLDAFYDATISGQLEGAATTAGGIPFGLTLQTLRARYGITADIERLSESCDLVIALGLVDREPSLRHESGFVAITSQEELRLTMLGRNFVAACRNAPRSEPGPP